MAELREPETREVSEPDLGPDAGDRAGPGSGIAVSEEARAGRAMADAVRVLALDAVAAAGSGCAGMALGMADVAACLWSRVLRFDATDPTWPDRDRVVLSHGPGAMLLYAPLHLTGHAGMELPALKRFRQLDSPAAGAPEHGEHPAIEATAGPPGLGLATAVGLALAERMMAARFGRSLVDHRCWVLAAVPDVAEGISHEAAVLAGTLRLGRLTVLLDDPADAPEAEDALKRFAGAGWATRRIDGQDPAAIGGALGMAVRSRKPTLIVCRTRPAPGGDGAAALLRTGLGWPGEAFAVPDAVAEAWARAGVRGTAARRAWLKRAANHPQRAEFERVVAGRLPESWHEATAGLRAEWADARPGLSTGQAGRLVHGVLAAAIPELAGSDGEPAALHALAELAALNPDTHAGRAIPYGGRAHAMAACTTGLALHGGVLPLAAGTLLSTDGMRPALRLAAQMRQRAVYVLTGDGLESGGDGPAWQPVEQLASLRSVPGVFVLRPADAVEAAECWELAIRRTDGPSLLVLSSQPGPALRTDAAENRCSRGGYVLAEADGPRQVTLVASGPEVGTAMEARRLLAAEGVAAAVVSLPCWELFAAQDETTRVGALGTAPLVGIEAGSGFGWERWLGPDGLFIGVGSYGASAPADTLYKHFGITPEAIAIAVRKRLPQPTPTEGT